MNLGAVLRAWRLHTEKSIRETAALIGLSSATYSRIELGGKVDGDTLRVLLIWLTEAKR